ncbi:hypothetical protein [Actinoplanes derwentensis]|uniref:PemK-like, MazF-like toxin of type II toxin-antitoxin system n=1 Tax=Actinoplanes derwentensis TaxID=113562 RepID=A0A1H1W343_9ACTN|nr:hypothetical protein [Actinoplanes derwentensis]GID84023.1 hypothetical protein Ade03nite_29470 [Actinoplanes derwentensis]SDS91081.1 hypothetical protein SAMN04489716_1958 [Actinoplanes derwentensis]
MLLILVPVLLGALVTPGPGNRFHWRRRRGYPSAGFAAPFVVAAGSLIVPAPVLLIVDLGRSLTVLDFVAAGLAPVAAFVVTRWVSPAWWKSSSGWIAVRAALLVTLVVGAELSTAGTTSLVRAWLVSAIVTAGYLACWRVLDTGYWPVLLIRDGVILLVVAGAAALGPGPFATRSTDPRELAVTLLIVVLAAAGLVAVLTGGWRLRRWLRHGPPFWPRPPGLASWPPEPGQVWNAAIIHDDDNHKDRPVVVWERTPGYVKVLTVTSVDKSAKPEHYLRMPLAEWHRVLTTDAWLSLELTPVPYPDFRSLRGECPERFWRKIGNRRIREPRSFTPSLTVRHRLRSAMNRRVGVDARS